MFRRPIEETPMSFLPKDICENLLPENGLFLPDAMIQELNQKFLIEPDANSGEVTSPAGKKISIIKINMANTVRLLAFDSKHTQNEQTAQDQTTGEWFSVETWDNSNDDKHIKTTKEVEILKKIGSPVFYAPSFSEEVALLVKPKFFGVPLSTLIGKPISTQRLACIAHNISKELKKFLQKNYLHCSLTLENILINPHTDTIQIASLEHCHKFTHAKKNALTDNSFDSPETKEYCQIETFDLLTPLSEHDDMQILPHGSCKPYIYSEHRTLIYTLGCILARLAKLTYPTTEMEHTYHRVDPKLSPEFSRKAQSREETKLNQAFFDWFKRMTHTVYDLRPSLSETIDFFNPLKFALKPNKKTNIVFHMTSYLNADETAKLRMEEQIKKTCADTIILLTDQPLNVKILNDVRIAINTKTKIRLIQIDNRLSIQHALIQTAELLKPEAVDTSFHFISRINFNDDLIKSLFKQNIHMASQQKIWPQKNNMKHS